MLQETAGRLAGVVAPSHTLVVAGRAHARAVRRQLPWLTRSNLLVEPEGRNTAAAIALAALHIERVHGLREAVMLVLPADHVIGNATTFRTTIRRAIAVAASADVLVTLGIKPNRPETGYGYIRVGSALAGHAHRVSRVAGFIEKPSRPRAEALLRRGKVLWNSGMFVWRVDSILRALRRYLPQVVGPLSRRRGGLAAIYRRLPSVSIDHGVLERARNVAVVPATFSWNDVGTWAAVESLWHDARNGNAVRGLAVAVDSRGCIVEAGRLVALLGVDDLVVVDTADALLVCRKDRAQDVRLVVEALQRRGLERYL